jgi:hypothetical protein
VSAAYGGMENDPIFAEPADQDRMLAAQIAAHASWAVTPDREVRTRPARAAFLARFERQVDPDNLLPPEERHLRAQSAKRTYFQSLALKSAKVRRRSGARSTS